MLSRWHPNVQRAFWIAVTLHRRKSPKWITISSSVYMYNFFVSKIFHHFFSFVLKLAFGSSARQMDRATGVESLVNWERSEKNVFLLFLVLTYQMSSAGKTYFSWTVRTTNVIFGTKANTFPSPTFLCVSDNRSVCCKNEISRSNWHKVIRRSIYNDDGKVVGVFFLMQSTWFWALHHLVHVGTDLLVSKWIASWESSFNNTELINPDGSIGNRPRELDIVDSNRLSDRRSCETAKRRGLFISPSC